MPTIQTPAPQPFVREKFDVLLVAALFLITFGVFVSGVGGETLTIWLKDICQAFLYALLALVGARGVRGNPAIGPATTESGDINIGPAAGGDDSPGGTKSNEKPNDI